MIRLVRAWAAGLALVALAAGPAAATREPPPWLFEPIFEFVRERLADHPVHIAIPPLDDFALPGVAPERIGLDLRTSAAAPLRGRVPLTLVIRVDGEEVRRGVVTVRIDPLETRWVASRRLERGERVQAADVEARPYQPASGAPGAIADPSQVVGLRTRRAVPEGATWRTELVETAPVVERGDRVELVLQRGPLRIVGSGKARQEGRPGERIRVLNPSSRREVVGRVSANGVVHVAF